MMFVCVDLQADFRNLKGLEENPLTNASLEKHNQV